MTSSLSLYFGRPRKFQNLTSVVKHTSEWNSELCFEFNWGTCCRKFCFRYVIFPEKLTSVYNDMRNNCSCIWSGGTYARMGIAWHEGTRDSHPEGNSLFTTFHFIGGLTGGVPGRKPTLSHLFQQQRVYLRAFGFTGKWSLIGKTRGLWRNCSIIN